MTKNQVLNKINSIIGDSNSWVEFYLNENSVAAIKIEDKYGYTKKEILEQFEIEKISDKLFNLWWNNKHGWTCITFDDCKINSY